MSYELIITEKPNAAKMIADALADYKPIKENNLGVPYYKISHNGKDIVVGCAVGHLYTVAEKDKSFNYPVFELEWKATDVVDTKSFTKKYISTLRKLAIGAKEFTIATDYDIEGEVIGLNCIRYICKQKDAARMKFSTLTKQDLVEAYSKKSHSLDWGQAYAGETRHFLDWMYGINLSRALTHAIKTSGMFKIMSSGRVQGPALKLIVNKEKEIKAFKSEKYWQIQLNGHFEHHPEIVEFWHAKDKFSNEKEVIHIIDKVKGKNGNVTSTQKSEFIQKAPVPFDLTTLQTEAYRFFGISPKHTLEIAQELYTGGFISYPRTSSQKLPKELGYKKLMESLAKNPSYTQLAKELLKIELKPTEGKKTDPAHPAIYPTGMMPKLHDREQKIYDLIVKRFLACFAQDARRETITIIVEIEKEPFVSKGTRTLFAGWQKYYAPYVTLEEQQMPEVKNDDVLHAKEVIKHDKETQPPKRFTPASIIRELERQNLGTKATRASIIDSLYQRNYVKNESLEATDLGIQTVETLEKYCSEILDAKLTRHFENEMEHIRQKKLTEDRVLEEAEKTLTKILEKFKKNEKSIGKELQASQKQSWDKQSFIGKCPNCKEGNLKIMYSKKSKKKFIACDAYPKCKTIMNLPGYGVITATEKICEQCKFPIIKINAGRNSRETCMNYSCPSKQSTDKVQQKEIKGLESGKIEKECPKCGKQLVLRRSVYGQFLGCQGYPKCHYIEKIPKDDAEKKAVEEKRAFFEKQAKENAAKPPIINAKQDNKITAVQAKKPSTKHLSKPAVIVTKKPAKKKVVSQKVVADDKIKKVSKEIKI